MSTETTADELLTLPQNNCRHELVAGHVKRLPFRTWRRGMIGSNLLTRLNEYVRRDNLGMLLAAGTGFVLDRAPDTVLAPDLAFVARIRFRDTSDSVFWPGSPDLAVEIVSADDGNLEIDPRAELWLNAGCRAVWVIDAKLHTVTIYQSPTNVQVKTAGETLHGDPVLPGFSCPVDELFR